MTKIAKPKGSVATAAVTMPTKPQQVVDMLRRENGTTLEEMSARANWLPHSTRAFMTGLKKKGYVIESEKRDGVRRYRIISPVAV
jgi:DNA-binding IclR family transcriptional regulator